MSNKMGRHLFLKNVEAGYLIAAFVALCLGLLELVYFRQKSLMYRINDFGTSWYLPNFFYMSSLGFFVLALKKIKPFRLAILFGLIIGAVLHEIWQYLGPENKFDIRDLAATLSGGILVLIIYLLKPKEK